MGGQLYWVLDNALMTMPVAGGPPKELAHGLVQPDSLRIDDTSAYWLAYGEQSGIHKVSLDGGSVTDLVIASTPTPIRQLALDGAYVYYTNAPSGSVVRVDKSGGVPTTIASGLEGPSDITADASGVYVVESGEKGAITRIPNGVDPAVRLAHDQAEPRSIVLTATEVYWIDGGVFDTATQTFIGAAVMKVSKAGGPPVEVAKADAANALFADGAQLYYTVGNAIVRAPASGGGASVFAEVVKPRAIAADATYVYWASAGSAAKGYLDGEVRRFKK